MMRNPGILDGNPFKFGLFGANCSGGLAFVTVPERWDASWEKNLKLARLADEAGIECLIPVARWKGFGGEVDVNGSTFETIAWATGLLANTRRTTVFGTIHVQMVHPIFAAKQMATADHVGDGRFGVNIVCGWNSEEFSMFNVEQYDHELRYEYGEEWWRVVRTIWNGDGESDFEGRFFHLTGLSGAPGPVGSRAPIMMNAGASPTGRAFAIRNSDLHFDTCRKLEDSVVKVRETKRRAREAGKNLGVWLPVSVVCRASRKEAEDYVRHCVETADWEALDHQYALYANEAGSRSRSSDDNMEIRRYEQARAVLGYGGCYSVHGDPDDVARHFARINAAGYDGAALGLVNYLEELPYLVQELLPRLEALGLRLKPTDLSAVAS